MTERTAQRVQVGYQHAPAISGDLFPYKVFIKVCRGPKMIMVRCAEESFAKDVAANLQSCLRPRTCPNCGSNNVIIESEAELEMHDTIVHCDECNWMIKQTRVFSNDAINDYMDRLTARGLPGHDGAHAAKEPKAGSAASG